MTETDERARTFLAALGDPGRGRIDPRTLAVLAHPDDETIGVGAQLGRFASLVLVCVTDGAPRGGAGESEATRALARTRADELRAALAAGQARSAAPTLLGIPDQEAARCAANLARRLARLFEAERAEIVLTHAYEGGHPDHDAVAFAVHAACRLAAREGARAPAIVEMPFYRVGPDGGFVAQRFVPWPGLPQLDLSLGPDEIARKQAMAAAHATQAAILSALTLDMERFRPAPAYDFSALPNDGRTLYEMLDLGVAPSDFLAALAAARRDLGLEVAPR